MMLGLCHRDLGQLAEADAVLSSFVAERLAPFQRAQRKYDAEAQAVRERLVSQAKSGQLPQEVEHRMELASGKDKEEEQIKIFREWLSERMEADPGLEKLRDEYLRHQTVVPAALMLGMVKLQRANDAEGEARRALLGEAERVFLSIRQEAEDNPRFHLGLGQVYHRLGPGRGGPLAKCVAWRAREAKHNATAANNTATALLNRYQATGDVAHLRSAVGYLEDAVRLAPDDALVMGNLADARKLLGITTVLERWVRTKPLHLVDHEAQELLEVLL